MMRPSTLKVLRDIWKNKAKALLVIISISIGVIGVGAIGQSLFVLNQGMANTYAIADPSSATLVTGPFDDRMVNDVRQLADVKNVQARTVVTATIDAVQGKSVSAADWKDMQLFAIPDFSKIQTDKLLPVTGAWPPSQNGLLLDRTALNYLDTAVGDTVKIRLTNGQTYSLKIVGSVRDPVRATASMGGVCYGYVTMDTLPTLKLPKLYNMLSFQVTQTPLDQRHIENVAAEVRDVFYRRGGSVLSTNVPIPGQHWAYDIVQSMGVILESLGSLVLLMGASLVVNTILAIITGQIRQIGVMKVLGATPKKLVWMYLATVLIYGALALAVGIPLGIVGTQAITAHSYDTLNFQSSGYRMSPLVLTLEILVGLVIPLLAALYPVIAGAHITTREAIAGNAENAGQFGEGRIDRMIRKIQRLPRPLILSLRNTFRRKGRLTLTLVTLGVGGAIVISVFSVHESMIRTLNNSLNYTRYDVQVNLNAPEPVDQLQSTARSVKAVTQVQAWSAAVADRVRPDGSVSGDISLLAPTPGTKLIQPTIVSGRWLKPGDTTALVVDTYLLNTEPDLRVGDMITLRINQKDTKWKIVGFDRKVEGATTCFVSQSELDRILGTSGMANELVGVTDRHDADRQAQVADQLSSRLKQAGFSVSSTVTTSDLSAVSQSRFGVVLIFLTLMAILLTLVAAIGLTGSMSLSVLERTREIGILRSVGAANSSIWGIVVTEGVIIGFISWVLGTVVSVPVSYEMSRSIGNSMFLAPLDYQFSVEGVWVWLAAAIVISALASFLPAWNASRLTLREVLSYE